jgi:signal peptidase
MEHNMKKNIKAICLTEIALLLLTIIFYMLTKVISSNLKGYLAITFLLIILIPNIFIFGFSNDRNYYSGYLARIVLTILMATAIIMYLLGLILGFTKGYVVSKSIILYHVLPLVGIIILSEVLRYNIVKYAHGNKILIILFTVLLSGFQILIETNFGALNTTYEKFIYISTVVFPTIADNFLCTYMVYKGNITNSILYKLIVELYMYIIPIVPNLGYYLHACFSIIVPYIIFYITNKDLLEIENQKKFIRASRSIYAIPVLIAGIVLIILVSGLGKYKLIAIATNSMNDAFYRGDAVLLEYKNANEIEIGDVLAFRHEKVVVTHRVVGIEYKNNKRYFNTKGDANAKADGYITSEEDVIGKVDYVIKYLGFPTIWTKELIEREG